MTYDHLGLGLADLFDVPDTSLGHLALAKRYLAEGDVQRAQQFVALAYDTRAREVAQEGKGEQE